jgi:hypothetical protein
MKKVFLYTALVLAGWFLHICTLEYVDWKAAAVVNKCIENKVMPAQCAPYQFNVVDRVVYWRPELYCYSSEFWKFVCQMR